MNDISIKQYEDAVSHALSERQIEILRLLYSFPYLSTTAKELAKALNYTYSPGKGSQIGTIGKKISYYTGMLPSCTCDDNGYYQPEYFSIVGLFNERTDWNMCENLQKALENLHIVSPQKALLE